MVVRSAASTGLQPQILERIAQHLPRCRAGVLSRSGRELVRGLRGSRDLWNR